MLASTKAALGQLLVNEDRWDEGKRMLREARDGGSFDAGLTLAEIAYRDRDVDGAMAMLERDGENGGLVYGSAAADMIGDIQVAEGDVAAGRRAYRQAMAIGQRDWSVIAAIDLAKTLLRRRRCGARRGQVPARAGGGQRPPDPGPARRRPAGRPAPRRG